MDKIPTIDELVALDATLSKASARFYATFRGMMKNPVIQGLPAHVLPKEFREEPFLTSFFLADHPDHQHDCFSPRSPEMAEAYTELSKKHPEEVKQITDTLSATYKDRINAQDAFFNGKKAYQAAQRISDEVFYDRVSAHRSQAARAAHPTVEPIPLTRVAPQPDTGTKPSPQRPTWGPEPKPKNPSLLEQLRNRFRRNKPGKNSQYENLVAKAMSREDHSRRELTEALGEISEMAEETTSRLHGGKIALGLGIAAAGTWAAYEALREKDRQEPKVTKR